MSNKLYVIGIGYKPLDEKAVSIIMNSEVILASKRLFEVFKRYEEFEAVKDKIRVINNVDETIAYIRSYVHSHSPIHPFTHLPSIVLLASGDPMFFGIGRRVVKEFGKDMVELIPDLSSVQMAFSMIKEPWDDAFLMSLHGGPDPEKRRRLPYEITDIHGLLQEHNKIAILTDKENSPAEIADVIARSVSDEAIPAHEIASPSTRNDYIKVYVCERLGYPDERITEGTPEEIAGMTFEEPNVVIIKSEVRSQKSEVSFGLKEDEITHSRGLITKDEVRAVTIHKLRLPQRGVLWDIGAGSGSVSIEAARLYPELKVFAIEKDDVQINHILENKIKFSADNVEAVKGGAPDALITLPHPDRVFIGGSGGRLKEIIDLIAEMKTSIIVVNATTIETLNEAVSGLESNGFEAEVSELSVSRSKSIAGKKHMSALNPIFITVGERKI